MKKYRFSLLFLILLFNSSCTTITQKKHQKHDSMVFIKGGTFVMGDIFDEGDSTEKPAHQVTVSNFYLSKYEVTVKEYKQYCDEQNIRLPRNNRINRAKAPVINVNWINAIRYCNWLSKKSGLKPCYKLIKLKSKKPKPAYIAFVVIRYKVTCNWKANGYRLPTEAEWEYAAREKGKKVRFGNGKNIAKTSEINFNGSINKKRTYSLIGGNRNHTLSVDSLLPNSLGLYHMSGNVWEWCWDYYDKEYYQNSTKINPKGANKNFYHTIRGGCYANDAALLRTSSRKNSFSRHGIPFLGFRVAKTY